MAFGRSRAKIYAEDDVKVSFGDVAGIDEAVDELREIVDFLRHPQKYTSLGGRIPKGKTRVASPLGTHEEREQTLNQLLAEMDGFDPRKGIIVMSATNRPEVLDPALLRPGRFDRRVVVTMLESPKPVVAVCAVRTGAGKSQTSRRIVQLLRHAGLRVVVVRHPMPYGDLSAQRVQRFAALADLKGQRCTIEEMEEYEPHLEHGTVVYAGVDYAEILERAATDADVILWDGGNNDLPFYRPRLHVVVADPLRLGNELTYHPGEANLRMADVVVINKVDTADLAATEELRNHVRAANPDALNVRCGLALVRSSPGNLVPGTSSTRVLLQSGASRRLTPPTQG